MKFKFLFDGGSTETNVNSAKAIAKFHCYICDPAKQEEMHLFQAIKTGVVNKREKWMGSPSSTLTYEYESVHPIIKIFTSTRGFGIPQEYFSYFFIIQPTAKKAVRILPLGFDKFRGARDYYFEACGRFLREEEIIRLYGRTSKTYMFYKRQTYIPARRIKQMVSVRDREVEFQQKVNQEVRMLRL